MGFLDGLGRFVAGKPVFQNDDGKHVDANDSDPTLNSSTETVQQDPNKTPVDSRGYKIIPEIEVSNLKTARNGGTMRSTLWITNNSDEEIMIESVSVGGQKQNLNWKIGPRSGSEVMIYDGKVKQNDNEYQADIIYRLVRSDDRFQNDYSVEYYSESDGAYMIEEFQPDGPTRDI